MHWHFKTNRKQDPQHNHLSLLDLAEQFDVECFNYPFKRIRVLIIYLGGRIIVGFQACLPDQEKKAILIAEMEEQKSQLFGNPVEPAVTLQDEDSTHACDETITEILEKALTQETCPHAKESRVLRIRAK